MRTFHLFSLAFTLIAAAQFADADDETKPGVELPAAVDSPVDFKRDVFPILQKHCVACHGPDAQEGQLRLDAKSAVFDGGVSGPVLKNGKSADSLLIHRIAGRGDGNRMPLDEEPLTDRQTGLIRAWIDQGARWPDEVGAKIERRTRHWAYQKPTRPALPAVAEPAWVNNSVDAFVLARLESAGIEPSPEASRERLIRRVTLDLTGMPPTPTEIDAYLSDLRPGSYERVVDRLLASPRYGERWAVPWLDAARYADSNGYQRDGRREYWAYRDWVVNALNADMPFDRFTIEQLAGDLLPDPALDQLIATGFHRGTMANVEAGTDPEEEHFLAVIDRVNTTGAVWLGSTIECAQCHSHKYDPFTQKDYYGLYAFFNNTEKEIEKKGSARDFVGPKIALPLADEKARLRKETEVQRDEAQRELTAFEKSLRKQLPVWEQEVAAMMNDGGWETLEPTSAESLEGASLEILDDQSIRAGGDFPGTDVYVVEAATDLAGVTAFRLEIMTDGSLPGGGPGRAKPGNFILSEFKVEASPTTGEADGRPVKLSTATADYSQNRWPVKNSIDGKRKTGWAVGPQFGRGHHAVFTLEKPLDLDEDARLRFTLDQQYGRNRTIGRFKLQATTGDPSSLGLPAEIQKLTAIPAEKRKPNQVRKLEEYYFNQSKEHALLQSRIKKLDADIAELDPPTTLVMKELDEKRTTRMFKRGDFLQPGEPVKAGVPASLHDFPSEATQNRLGLAKWIVAPDNPLTARVVVNRAWAEFFGRGLVTTIEDFGTQGAAPTHPELLDWLAVEFASPREHAGDDDSIGLGWRMKLLHRLIVTSATYRQSARVTPELLKRDFYNALYARGPRFRLKAEYIRDNALAAAGLLSGRMQGPPVFPLQPDGVWNHIGRASNAWTTSEGDNLYRRGLYVYWRRTVPYPSFVNFDAPTREACTVQRSRSNTPLQALTLMNDPVYIEAAAALAARMTTEPAADAVPAERVSYGFRLATSRTPTSAEVEVLENRYQTELARCQRDEKAADALINQWRKYKPAGAGDAEFAAWMHVANVLLNLDETITR